MDQLLQDIKKIVSHVEEITESLQGAVGGIEGRQQLKSIFDNLDVTTQRMASFSTILDRSISNNEENIDRIFEIGDHVARISDRLESQVLPSLQDGIDRIAHAFDRDFNRVATQIETSANAFEEASVQARDGFKSLSAVAEKIDEGKGLIGKLINDEDTYRDLKVAVQGIRNYFASADTLQIVFDSHVEAMQRPAEIYKFEDSKGYFDMRIYPTEDKFYLIQLAVSERGYIDRFAVSKAYKDLKGDLVDTRKLLLTDAERLEDVFTTERAVILRNSYKFGLQFGKIFGDIALRFGLFEGFAGFGVDFEIPLRSNRFRWITTFELFDLRGWNRRGVEATDDRRPHAKWINRMFVLDNIYFTFGADDFASKRNANTFVGAGVRFCDDDVKFLLSNVSALIPSLATNPDLALTVNAGN
jgi:phospholipid/cholesterol/gamma-HCH transport system substrate-binding protein